MYNEGVVLWNYFGCELQTVYDPKEQYIMKNTPCRCHNTEPDPDSLAESP